MGQLLSIPHTKDVETPSLHHERVLPAHQRSSQPHVPDALTRFDVETQHSIRATVREGDRSRDGGSRVDPYILGGAGYGPEFLPGPRIETDEFPFGAG